jgi:hypothetical protein
VLGLSPPSSGSATRGFEPQETMDTTKSANMSFLNIFSTVLIIILFKKYSAPIDERAKFSEIHSTLSQNLKIYLIYPLIFTKSLKSLCRLLFQQTTKRGGLF